MKMNWGKAIFLFYSVFAAILIFVLYQSTKVDRSLVLDNYYQYDLDYQEHYLSKSRVHNAEFPYSLQYDTQEELISLQLPEEGKYEGIITFYRPSNAKLDFEVEVKNTFFQLSSKDLLKGRWIVKLEFQEGDKKYSSSEDIYII